jgi:hypothetical protein
MLPDEKQRGMTEEREISPMLSAVGTRLGSILLMLVQAVYGTQGATISLSITAYALHTGDVAAFRVCNLAPGISVRFEPNPARAGTNRQGVLADRARFTLHVSPSVKPGEYHLFVLSYSFVDGSRSWPRISGYTPDLRVFPDHAVAFPQFSDWFYIPYSHLDGIAITGTCSPAPGP